MNGLYYLKECASTNDEILSILENQTERNVAAYTFHQTKGRGQYGNSWESPKNQNIAFSFALDSETVKISDSLFNFYTAVIFRNFLANLTKKQVEIKWPNDLIINKKKVSGILIEKRKVEKRFYFIIGIGLNVLQENFENLPKAGSLLTQTGRKFDLHELSENLFQYLIQKINFEIDGKKILKMYNDFLFRKNLISVFEIENMRQNGIIKKADKNGFLWVDLENDGLKKFYFKEISLFY